MSVVLNRTTEAVYNSTKNRMAKELEGHIFNLKLVAVEKKEWKKFQEKIANTAHVLLTEINRSQGNYRRFSVDELTKDYQSNDNYYFFDFFGDNGSIRVAFKKGLNGYIRFDHIEEDIYKQILSLF